MTRANRKVGLGMMGFAELLIRLGIPYTDERAVTLADELMRFLDEQTLAASEELARERGVFPNWERSVYRDSRVRVRNATRTSIAPTGTLSIIAGTSPSIEPLFGLAYRRRALDGQTLLEWNPLVLRVRGRARIGCRGHQTRVADSRVARPPGRGIPGDERAVPDCPGNPTPGSPCNPGSVSAACRQCRLEDGNLPHGATPGDVATIYRSAWERGLKGITIYRYWESGGPGARARLGRNRSGP